MADSARYLLVELDAEQHLASFAHEVRAGLSSVPKQLPCRFFYDTAGSQIFEEICDLPDYYLTRSEREILEARCDEIAGLFPKPIALVELGSGNSSKTRLLIEALVARHGALAYVPVDISASILEASSLSLLEMYPQLEIRAIAGEYQDGLRQLRGVERPKLIIFLGSTIGNLGRDDAGRFASGIRQGMSDSDRLLLGIDLRKNREVLERAYDDASGVTARFNRNLLVRINRELGGQFDAKAFDFRATYDPVTGTVDSYLVSRFEQSVCIEELDLEVRFGSGETIHTESSVKYSIDEIDTLARSADLYVVERWLDTAERFSLNLLAPRAAGC